MDDRIVKGREFLKDTLRQKVDFSQTPQSLGFPPPPSQKPLKEGQEDIPLPKPEQSRPRKPKDLPTTIAQRKSRRKYINQALTLKELSFLLWATQGVREVINPAAIFRTVPSAGCRHALETYLAILDIQGLSTGLYRYLPLDHAITLESQPEHLPRDLMESALGQPFCAQAAVTFIWTAIPERMEWRYGAVSHKVIALDAGHICQNLYLACETIDTGTCAIAAYHQQKLDALLGIDGQDEFAIYLAPVGKIR